MRIESNYIYFRWRKLILSIYFEWRHWKMFWYYDMLFIFYSFKMKIIAIIVLYTAPKISTLIFVYWPSNRNKSIIIMAIRNWGRHSKLHQTGVRFESIIRRHHHHQHHRHRSLFKMKFISIDINSKQFDRVRATTGTRAAYQIKQL